MPSLTFISWIAAVLYAAAVGTLALYGVHSLWLLVLFLRHHRAARAQAAAEVAAPLPTDADLPTVLVQLPVFNERDVVTRLVECAGRLDWPKDRLVIQLLDDSTDDSVEIGRQAIATLRAQGFDAHSLHRTDRTGFKAGALDAGMRACDAPFIAIFDADFLPNPDFLRVAIKPLLADPGLALVQGRWDHLNREENLLTRAQALGIDGHFAIEQGARAWSGLAMNFNGTCGLWRRTAIIAGGGWEHDTLTEDMDLSYRVQLVGWRCTYRLGLAVPGEIPASLAAWRQQQFRWAKGSIQTACKLLPRVWRSSWSLHARLAATLHMTHYLVHPLILLSLLCAPPAMLLAANLPAWILVIGLFGFVLGAGAPPLLYAVSQWVLDGPRGWRRLGILPALAAIGTGIAVSNARAVWEALIGRQSEFVRTPKQGFAKRASYKAGAATGIPELLCVCWAALGVLAGLGGKHAWIAPLLLIYISGFGWVAGRSLYERLRAGAHAAGSPLLLLVPLGLALAGGFALLVRGGGSWRLAPGWSAVIACGLGALWLAAVAVVRRRPGGAAAFAWIIAVALALRVIAVGWMPPAVETHRALFEGRQVATGQDAYAVAPDDAQGRALLGGAVPDSTFFAITDRAQPASTAPLLLWFNGLLSEFAASPRTFKVAAALLELAALALVLALLARWHLPFGLVVVAAWHPLLPLFGAGEGHLDIVVGVLIAAGLLAAAAGRHLAGAGAASLAMLARPWAAVALLPHLVAGSAGAPWRQRARLWLAPLLIAALAVLSLDQPRTAIAGLLDRAVAQAPLHGALEPWLRVLVETWLGTAHARPLVLGLLAVTFTAGAWWLHHNAASRGLDREHPGQHAHLLALGLICLPVLTPWLLVPLALLLPFTRSWGLLLWTALAPLYWLHDHRAANGGENLVASAIAHVPALLLVAWEAAGRPTPWRQPVAVEEAATA